jgi:hypothetical protein
MNTSLLKRMAQQKCGKFSETFGWPNQNNLEDRIFGEVNFLTLMPLENTITSGTHLTMKAVTKCEPVGP